MQKTRFTFVQKYNEVAVLYSQLRDFLRGTTRRRNMTEEERELKQYQLTVMREVREEYYEKAIAEIEEKGLDRSKILLAPPLSRNEAA